MCHNIKKYNNSNTSKELFIIGAEIMYRHDKIDELMLDIAEEMKILRKLQDKKEIVLRHWKAR